MNKILTIILVIVVGVIVGLVGFGTIKNSDSQNLSGFLTPTVTNTSITVNTTTTQINAAGTNLQKLILKNITAGQTFCAFGTVATTNTGLVIDAPDNTTSTDTYVEIVDPNLLGKTMDCLSTKQGTISILRY